MRQIFRISEILRRRKTVVFEARIVRSWKNHTLQTPKSAQKKARVDVIYRIRVERSCASYQVLTYVVLVFNWRQRWRGQEEPMVDVVGSG